MSEKLLKPIYILLLVPSVLLFLSWLASGLIAAPLLIPIMIGKEFGIAAGAASFLVYNGIPIGLIFLMMKLDDIVGDQTTKSQILWLVILITASVWFRVDLG